jgi:hypothetical protein
VGGAHINVLVARVPPASTILPSEQVMTRGREVRLRAQESTRSAALKATFDAWNATPEMVAKFVGTLPVTRPRCMG